MGKNVFFTTIIVFLIVADVTNAAFFWNSRKLFAPSPKEDPNVSPIPSPGSGEKQLNPVGGVEKAKEKANEKQNKLPSPDSTSGEDKSKDKQAKHDTGLPSPTDAKEVNKTTKEEVTQKDKGNSDFPSVVNESCDEIGRRCQDTKSMIACIKNFDDVSKALVLLIQNEGDSSLKVDLTNLPPGNKQNVIDIPKHQTKKVNISVANGGNNKITLNAGYGECVIHLGVGAPTSQGNYFQWLLSYSKFMTPLFGAYFLLLTTVVSGLVWACCCWFSRRKRHGDVPYQELEMSMPESAVVAESAQGWDQDWDDDWDEEHAVKSPGGPGPNISANGLTSRTPNKDGWEDWAE